MQKQKIFSQKNQTRRLAHFLFVLPCLILYLMFFIFPVIMGFYYGLTDWDGMSKQYSFVGLKNYFNIFKDPRFIKALLFNIRYSAMLLICVVGISLCLALVLNSNIRFKSFFRGAFFFPAVLSMVTVGFIFNEIFARVLPMAGSFLHMKILSRSLLARPETAIFGILLVNIWQGVAMPTVLFITGLQSVPQELVEAAKIDGASPWQRFKSIVFPFLLPILSVVLVLVLKDGLTVFDYIQVLTQGGPAGHTESISLLIYIHGFTEMRFSYAIAEAVVVSVIIFCISIVQIKYTQEKRVY